MSSRVSKTTPDSVFHAAAVGANLLWSTSFVATKLAYASFPPLTLGAMRHVIAALILGAILLTRGGRKRLDKGDANTIALGGLLGYTLYFALENIGVSLSSASNAALIVASYPAITALLERIFYKASISGAQAAGIAAAMAGVFILTGARDSPQGANEVLGNIILILSGFVWASYNFATRKTVSKYPSLELAFYQTTYGAVFFLPLTLFEINQWRAPTTESILVLLYLAIICSVAAFLLYTFGLRRLSPSASVSTMNLVPVFGVICSVLVLDETIALSQMTGGAIVIGGVWLSLRRPSPQNRTPDAPPEHAAPSGPRGTPS